MEYRKLIAFGKNSFVISIPKAWIRQQKLNKGDLIYIDENAQNLVLSTQAGVNDNSEKEVTINVNGKSIRRIQREIISAYIKDHKSIILVGEEIKDKARRIQHTIQNLMALEIMEQTSKRIVAKDFLDMNNISIFNLIQKIDVIIRAMIEDCEMNFEEDNHENIYLRDNDVNRLCFLVFRYVEFGLNNSSFIYKKRNLSSRKLLNLWWFTFNLEAVADEVKRIAKYMKDVNLNKKEQKAFLELLSSSKMAYLKIIKGFHNNDVELAHEVLEMKDSLIKQCEEFYNINKNKGQIGKLLERLKSKINSIHNLGRVIYQESFTEE